MAYKQCPLLALSGPTETLRRLTAVAEALLRKVVTFNLYATSFQPLHISRKIDQNLIDI